MPFCGIHSVIGKNDQEEQSPGIPGQHRGPSPPLSYCSGRYCPLVVPHITVKSWPWEGQLTNTIYTSKYKVSWKICSLASKYLVVVSIESWFISLPDTLLFQWRAMTLWQQLKNRNIFLSKFFQISSCPRKTQNVSLYITTVLFTVPLNLRGKNKCVSVSVCVHAWVCMLSIIWTRILDYVAVRLFRVSCLHNTTLNSLKAGLLSSIPTATSIPTPAALKPV